MMLPRLIGLRWKNSGLCGIMKTMGNFNRDDNRSGGYSRGAGSGFAGRGGFSRGGGRGGFSRGGDRGDRQMFDATCSNCGKSCQVPFRPTNGKPVYCSDCFEKMGGRADRQTSDRPRFEDRKPSFDQNKAQLDAISVKLDKILNILEPKVVTPVVKEEKKAEGPEPIEGEIKPLKIKPASAKASAGTKAVKKAVSSKSGKAGSSSAGKK